MPGRAAVIDPASLSLNKANSKEVLQAAPAARVSTPSSVEENPAEGGRQSKAGRHQLDPKQHSLFLRGSSSQG